MELLIKILTQFFGNGMMIMGLVALFGSIVQKKKISDTLLSVVKCMLGFAILDGGSTLLCAAIDPLKACILEGLNAQGVIQQMFPAYVTTQVYASETAIVFLGAMIVNGILVRLTKLKGFALTVHLQLFVAANWVTFLHVTNLSEVAIMIISIIGAGVCDWLEVSVSHYYMTRLDMTDEHGIFVFDNWGYIMADLLSKVIGKGKDTEDISFPESLMWLKDTFSAITITMIINYLVFGLVAGIDYVNTLAGGKFWWEYLIIQSFGFSAGLATILYGVKMFVSELVPAFVALSEKFLPDAIVGLDYPTVFQYAPTAVMFGFVANVVGSIIGTLIQVGIHSPIIVVPGIQGQFFSGAIVGVFANRLGGLRNVLISSFLYGLLTILLIGVIAPYSGVIVAGNAFWESIEFSIFPLLVQRLLAIF